MLSSFVEIQGQERDKIIDLIKAKCIEPGIDIDANIMLAIAGVESHFKPYAVGFTEEELGTYKQNNNRDAEDILGARGIFQLRLPAAHQTNVSDRFDWFQNIEGGVKYYQWITYKVTKRGNVFEKRLIAWHDGIGNVPGKFEMSKLSGEMKQFLFNIQANYKKRDWKKIIFVPAIIFVIWFSFSLGQNWFPVAYPVPVVVAGVGIEAVKAAEQPVSAPDDIRAGKSLVFEDSVNGIKKIIVRENRDQDDGPITRLAYWSESDSVTTETLDGWLVRAGWKDGFFYVWREAGIHATPAAIYSIKDGHLVKVAFVEKDGRTRDEIQAPHFMSDAYNKIIRERQYHVDDVPHNVFREVFKDFKYYPPDNTFYEFRIIHEDTDMGNG